MDEECKGSREIIRKLHHCIIGSSQLRVSLAGVFPVRALYKEDLGTVSIKQCRLMRRKERRGSKFA